MRSFAARMGILGELMLFLWKRKLYWLLPLIVTLAIFAVLLVAGGSSVLAPFVYPFF